MFANIFPRRLLQFFSSAFLFCSVSYGQNFEKIMYDEKNWHSFIVEYDFVFVSTEYYNGEWTLLEQEQLFTNFGLESLQSKDLKIQKAVDTNHQHILGYPIWFDQSKKSSGIITREWIAKITSPSEVNTIRHWSMVNQLEKLDFDSNSYLIKLKNIRDFSEFLALCGSIKTLVFVHPNFVIPHLLRTSGPSLNILDEFYPMQWHLKNTGQTNGKVGADIQVEEAWQLSMGSEGIKIAVIDGGFDLGHPDLKDNWDYNLLETYGNNLDDDKNSFIDDVIGFNFGLNSSDFSFLGPRSFHGTAVAGLIAASKNNIGVIGVCPTCKIVPIIMGSTPLADAKAFYYALSRGADVISNSWGYALGTPTTAVVKNAIADVVQKGRKGKGLPVFFAMNNAHVDDCSGKYPDISSLDSVIAISGSNHKDEKVFKTGYGKCMDFLAPTRDSDLVGIVTTDVSGSGGYNIDGSKDLFESDYTQNFGGTSAATPISAGIAALALSLNPHLTRDDLYKIFQANSDKIAPIFANYDTTHEFSSSYGFGRLNAYRILKSIKDSLSPTN